MPSFKLQIHCLECRWHRTGYYIKALNQADKHAEKFGHALDAWRLNGIKEPTFFCSINAR